MVALVGEIEREIREGAVRKKENERERKGVGGWKKEKEKETGRVNPTRFLVKPYPVQYGPGCPITQAQLKSISLSPIPK
jgi:hypothetical protein